MYKIISSFVSFPIGLSIYIIIQIYYMKDKDVRDEIEALMKELKKLEKLQEEIAKRLRELIYS